MALQLKEEAERIILGNILTRTIFPQDAALW